MDALETNQNTDTPSNEGSGQLSVEEAFFTSEEQNTTNNEIVGTPEVQDTPAGDGDNLNIEKTQNENDERRYQYWQSEADKAKNENAQLKAQIQQVQQMQQAQPAPAQQETVEEFPPPPTKPKQPMGFNRAEAMEDPNSASAQYLNELDEWRDNTVEYNALKNEYQTALVRERLEEQEKIRVQEIQRQQAYAQQNQQMNELYQRVQGEHGLTPEEASEFIQTMSQPESLTMDNLVQLYRMHKGSGQTVQTQPTGPSDTFNQQARAQQVPSPMGVLPAQQNESTASAEDNIMDSMISDYKKSNPW
tara:strand:+ start:209 stop:1120 length:912 start_codon:yes stop_codon:yes gene_type:complete